VLICSDFEFFLFFLTILTFLIRSFSDAMNEALELHDSILREVLQLFKGYEVKTEGSMMFVLQSVSLLDQSARSVSQSSQ
jgi:hypothetical protein